MQTSNQDSLSKSGHPVEDILARLMPAAVSVEGQRAIEKMIDGLAESRAASPLQRARQDGRKWFWSAGIAASMALAGLAAAGNFSFFQPQANQPKSWLGMSLVKNDAPDTRGIGEGIGLVVRKIDPNGAAAKVGLREGDLLVSLDGQKLVNEIQLATLLRNMNAGQSARFVGYRGHHSENWQIEITEKIKQELKPAPREPRNRLNPSASSKPPVPASSFWDASPGSPC